MFNNFLNIIELCTHISTIRIDLRVLVYNKHHTVTVPLFFVNAGHSRVVDLLLRSRAKIDVVNKIGKTAAQLGGFVGLFWISLLII